MKKKDEVKEAMENFDLGPVRGKRSVEHLVEAMEKKHKREKKNRFVLPMVFWQRK